MTREGIREWIRDVINSSTTKEHLIASEKLTQNYSNIYGTEDGLLEVLRKKEKEIS